MNKKAKNKSVPCFDMQFITSSISTTLVLLLLGLVVFFVLGAHNLSVYVKENINFSILISDDMKESDILKLQKKLDKEPFVKETEYISKKQALREQTSGTTNIIVAQRIGTIRDADCILVIEDGAIVGKGTHRELMESCKVYQEIAYSQLSKEELAS